MAVDNAEELDEVIRAARATIGQIRAPLTGVPFAGIVAFAGAVPSTLSVTLEVSTLADGASLALVIVNRRSATPRIFDGLTSRQREVARFMARGWSNDQIARALGISLGTTKDHVHAILRRSGCRTRAGFAAAASATDLNDD